MSAEDRLSISVVIPVLNAAPYLPSLLAALERQQPVHPDEVILVDSGSTDATVAISGGSARVRVLPLDRFTHGRSRNRGVQAASSKVVVLMTQDAIPEDENWLARLVEPLGTNGIVATCSRQVPRKNASPMERFFLQKRFPRAGEIRNLERLGSDVSYERVLFSDVSCAVLRDRLLEHPYDEALIMGEDQKLARELILAGHAMAYVPESVVIHSHRYSLLQTFRRYFDSVYALAAIFPEQTASRSVHMGLAYVREELAFIARHAPWWLLYYPAYVAVKAAATLLAHHAAHLPRPFVRWASMHAYHWE
jgi:rhamnosyltransferase